jgi:hypothetical protein
MSSGDGREDGRGVTREHIDRHADLGAPPEALLPVEAGTGHHHDAGGHGLSGSGRRSARAMIVRWISDVPS